MTNFSNQPTIPILTNSINEENQTSIESVPQFIGPYKIKKFFAKGGMSLLYLGEDPKTKKKLIIKTLPPEFLENTEMTNRFLKEAEIIAMTRHPNIAKLYRHGSWEQGLYIAMEYVDGSSLKTFLQNNVFSQKKALEIVLQVAYALCHLHDHKIIHRDLKPENILITKHNEIKVIDFGIAQLNNIAEESIMGTPAYIPPEQKKDPKKVSFQSDIYALGTIAYELITGKLSHGVIIEDLIPDGFLKNTILKKALNEHPEKRYKNIVEFITDLSKYLAKITHNREIAPTNVLESANDILIPKSFNAGKDLDIQIFAQKKHLLSGVYVDHFKLTDNRSLLFLAETKKTGKETVNYISMLSGVVKAVYHFNKKMQKLSDFLSVINQIIFQEINYPFLFAAILFVPNENKIIYSSKQEYILQTTKEKEIKPLITNNPFLGENKNNSFCEKTASWDIDNQLFLFSSGIFIENGKNKCIQKTSLKQKLSHIKKAVSDKIIIPSDMDKSGKKVLDELENKYDFYLTKDTFFMKINKKNMALL